MNRTRIGFGKVPFQKWITKFADVTRVCADCCVVVARACVRGERNLATFCIDCRETDVHVRLCPGRPRFPATGTLACPCRFSLCVGKGPHQRCSSRGRSPV